MKKKLIIGLGIVGALLLSGCTGSQPQPFNPNNKVIEFVQGKPYSIPYSSNLGSERISPQEAKEIRRYGVPCSSGDIAWISTSFASRYKVARDTADTRLQMLANGYGQGIGGCVSPLSNQQYQYALNQQNQQAANARVSSQSYSNNYSVPSYTRSSSNSYSDSISSLSRPYSSTGPSGSWTSKSRKKNTYSVRRLDDNHYSVSSR